MKFSKKTVNNLYAMNCLTPTNDSELEAISSQLAAFSQGTDGIKSADFEKNCNIDVFCEFNSLREDTVNKSFPVSDITKNSKNVKNNCFTIPKLI